VTRETWDILPMWARLVTTLGLVAACGLGVAAIVDELACGGALDSTVAAVTEDPRIRSDAESQNACRQVGRDVQLDAGGDASPAIQAVGFAAYCVCTIDAGLRGSCPK
jgi:hypothetical protein